jgi:poly-gamma-glutamate synthesis protein (capsule biosynthesis protein)
LTTEVIYYYTNKDTKKPVGFKNRFKILTGVRIVFFSIVFPFLFCCAGFAAADYREGGPVPGPEEAAPAQRPEPAPDYLTLVAAGDNLYQEPILKEFFNQGAYCFDLIYSRIKAYIEPAGIAFVNQETVLGKGPAFSGYPLFNTPQAAGEALAAAGFDVINHATNHILDKGEAGVLETMDYWDAFPGIRYTGISRSEEDRRSRRVIIEKNNIRVGFLAYTESTNGLNLPENKPYLVSLADTDKMAEEIDALRPLCDFLAVSMHWGNEYQEEPSAAQKKLAEFLALRQVDLVIGHHPHVLQPLARIPRPDGGVLYCFYSLGNFVSAHAWPEKPALLGGLMYMRLKKTRTAVTVDRAGLIPLISHYEKDRTSFVIYPLQEYTEALADKHWKRTGEPEMTVAWFYNSARSLIKEDLLPGNPFAEN